MPVQFSSRLTRRSVAAGAMALAGFAWLGRATNALEQPSASPEASPMPGSAPRLLLRMELTGGLTTIESLLVRVPDFSLFDDGSIYRLGPTTAIYPPAALPNLTRMQVSPETVDAIMAQAGDAGLDAPRVITNPAVQDAPTTQFTYFDGENMIVTTAAALMLDTPVEPSEWDDETVEAVAGLRGLVEYLNNLVTSLPDDAVLEPETPVDPERLQVIAFEATDDNMLATGVPDQSQPPIAWPLDESLADLGAVYEPFEQPGVLPPLRCAALSGDDAAAVVAASREGNFTSPWTSDDAVYGLLLKPLLPDQAGCEAISE